MQALNFNRDGTRAVFPAGRPEAGGEPAADKRPGHEWLRNGILTVLLYLLFREWIAPLVLLADVTEIYYIQPFLLAFALFMTLDYCRTPAAAGVVLKLGIVVLTAGFLHYPHDFGSLRWLGELAQALMGDGGALLRGAPGELSPPARTILFLGGWAFLISVVQSLAMHRQHVLWFVALTLIYLAALPAMFSFDAAWPMLRALGLGLLLQALVQLPRLEELHGLTPRRAFPAAWLAAAALLAAGCAAAAYGGAQLAGRDAPPVDWRALAPALGRWLEPYAAPAAAPAARAQTGYGDDDAVLGSPLSADARVAFYARTPRLTYWRGEAKSSYDGRGWRPVANRLERAEALEASEPAPGALAQEVLPRHEGLGRQLFAAGDIVRVDAMRSERGEALSGALLWADAASGRTVIPIAADALGYYKVWSVPAPAAPRPDGAAPASPPEGSAAYLQLPDTLPARVAELAKRVTAGAATPFEQAKAVEAYLRASYAYTLDATKPPAAGEDFVDHFLFEQRQGYCNHFSTAMAVMLRTVGIPTRWVKGFAPGSEVAPEPAGFSGGAEGVLTVAVSGKDAHSWVEAYIPGTGWMAFEPTPGFAGTGAKQPPPAAEAASAEAAAPESAGLLAGVAPFFAAMAGEAPLTALVAAAALVLLLAAVPAVWRRRRNLSAEEAFSLPPAKPAPSVRLLHRLWRKWTRQLGGGPRAGQTVREFTLSRTFASDAERQAAFAFVKLIEEASYQSGSGRTITKRQVLEIWRGLQSSRRR